MARRMLAGLIVVLVIVALASSIAIGAPPVVRTFDDLTAQLSKRVPGLLQRYGAAAGAIALLRDGKPQWVHGFGYADRSRRAPVTDQTVFQAASMSKAVTAWGVMRLVETGRISLDAPVNTYLKRWHLSPTQFGSPDDVTVRRLLSHTAGLSIDGYQGVRVPLVPPDLLNDFATKAKQARIVAPPGRAFRYSGGGYAVLQLLIEDVTNQPFDRYMRDEVLRPLGMNSSGYFGRAPLPRTVAVPYDASGNPIALTRFTEDAPEGLYTTAGDYARFLAAAVGNAPTVLRRSTVDEMLAPQAGTAGAEPLSQTSSYGLGYFLDVVQTHRVAYHPGVNPGWGGIFAVTPGNGDGIVVLSSGEGGTLVSIEASCLWSRWATGRELSYCSVLHRGRASMFGSSLAVGVLLLVAFIASVRAWNRLPPRRSFGVRARALAFLAGGAAWAIVWHTDFVARHLWDVAMIPAALMPLAFPWVSVVLMSLCVLLAVTRLAGHMPGRLPSRDIRNVIVAAFLAAAWWLTWNTTFGLRVLIGTKGLEPSRASTGIWHFLGPFVFVLVLAFGARGLVRYLKQWGSTSTTDSRVLDARADTSRSRGAPRTDGRSRGNRPS